MAITRTERQIKFSSANTVTITAGSNATSDAITGIPADELIERMIAKADNQGTPVSGDTVDVWIMVSAGDPDADPDTTNEYPDVNHLQKLCRLDTFATDPALKDVQFSVAGIEDYKIYVENNAASSVIFSMSGQGVDFE